MTSHSEAAPPALPSLGGSAPTDNRAANIAHLDALGLTGDFLGERVREAWVRWAEQQPNPKSSWLVPWSELGEADREADRQIGRSVALFTLLAARATLPSEGARP